MPIGTSQKNNVFVQHRRVQSHGQTQQFNLQNTAKTDGPTSKVHSPKPELQQAVTHATVTLAANTPQAAYQVHPATKLKQMYEQINKSKLSGNSQHSLNGSKE